MLKVKTKSINRFPRLEFEDYGNDYTIYYGLVTWKQGDSGSTESYACGRKYIWQHRYVNIDPVRKCNGGYEFFRFWKYAYTNW